MTKEFGDVLTVSRYPVEMCLVYEVMFLTVARRSESLRNSISFISIASVYPC